MNTDINIYVADLAAYNNGILHGVWIDATQDLEDIHAQIQTMLAASPVGFAEEYAIHDYEGFCGYSVSEYEGLEQLHDIACFIEEQGEMAAKLLDYCCDLDEAKTYLSDNYCGSYSAVAEFAQEITEETTDIPESLCFYIDYERMAHDLECGGDIFTLETQHQTHIFWSR